MQQGMSLIELLIVVAVTGILAAIAYPSYSDQLRRAARSEVVGLLHDAALRLERHRVRTGQYAEGELQLPVANRHYRLHAQRDSDTFTLLAQRLPGGLMADDRCGDFQLDQAGVQGNPNAVPGSERCWGS
ncbi:prepilin-type N-terminal cleavage/methylation domain-containing protein [Pantoea sp. Tr-811]|uniref:type IV pilin protein n=1 Tax=unclassified Pantoea TaxID=2630326 RepID=UPI00141DA332|nr:MULTISPECIES: type IV pilin protein [unclassified Pantoea]NIE74177.1 prepilin-type N-terminal cleavage/methylation domain-containing protein [Pantoea sp. Ap-967]NIF30178.1 prepilin-type N-terminal cleavage/methylation domain-containing protein [Pantoea sp. Tr-811]